VVIAQADYWKRVEYRKLDSSSQQSQATLYKCPPAYCQGSVESLMPYAANYSHFWYNLS
jgi:hypothetical protein